MPIATASQTIGPYWHLIEHPEMADLTRFGADGERIVFTGRVTDGDGLPVSDACVEIWQAQPEASEAFPGYGRAGTDVQGMFRFVTIKPGPVPGVRGAAGNAPQAPHLSIAIFARGLVKALHTRAWFGGERLNESDPVLGLIEPPARRATVIARQDGQQAGMPVWRLNLRLQGDGETLFMEV
ncbi:MAG TPA: protocatechuate 3,4-dioxygenase subunit alpha [Acetobacteraceae bacterium]|nr:protocatechuate 3,4-dioxygenase subunit alpha [Acetobacteraceae bacterium]